MTYYNPKKVIKVAKAEVGYCEKKSAKSLNSKTANAGSNNYTKYSRDLNELGIEGYQGQPWCDTFVSWCFVQAYGKSAAKKLLHSWSAYTPTSANDFKEAGEWKKKPSKGAQIFFTNSSGTISHTGIVYDYDDGKVYTIEGNTSSASGVVANGGCVAKKSYSRGYSRIAGYGKPAWGKKPAATSQPTGTKDIEAIAQEVIDGKWGDGTERENRLAAAGYSYAEIQAKVNELLGE